MPRSAVSEGGRYAVLSVTTWTEATLRVPSQKCARLRNARRGAGRVPQRNPRWQPAQTMPDVEAVLTQAVESGILREAPGSRRRRGARASSGDLTGRVGAGCARVSASSGTEHAPSM